MKGIAKHSIHNQVLIAIISVAMFVLCMPADAYAYTVLTCGAGGSVASGTLYNIDTSGNGLCKYMNSDPLDHLFSYVICKYAMIINDVLDAMYCSIQFGIKKALTALIVLYIAITGFQSMYGHVQLTVGEAIVRSCKIAFVWYFATDAAYGIGVGFMFFMSFMGEGVKWVINAIDPSIGVTPDSPIAAYAYIDELIKQAILGPFTQTNSKVVGFFMVMSFAYFPIFLMGLSFVIETAKLLISCVITFLLSISAIAFLIALSPIFLGFMLFQSTAYLFENWLKYMISYTLQVIVIFAIVVMWTLVMKEFVWFFNALSNMIFSFREAMQPGNMYQPSDTWGICPEIYYYVNAKGPMAECVTAPYTTPDAMLTQAQANDLIPPSRIIQEKGFLYFVVFHMISLIIIAYAFFQLLKNASNVARELVGPAYVPTLGKGFGAEALGDPSGYPNKLLHQGSTGVGRR
jgi:hypothetical protein